MVGSRKWRDSNEYTKLKWVIYRPDGNDSVPTISKALFLEDFSPRRTQSISTVPTDAWLTRGWHSDLGSYVTEPITGTFLNTLSRSGWWWRRRCPAGTKLRVRELTSSGLNGGRREKAERWKQRGSQFCLLLSICTVVVYIYGTVG